MHVVRLAFGLNIEEDLCSKFYPVATRTVLHQESVLKTNDTIFFFHENANCYALQPLG